MPPEGVTAMKRFFKHFLYYDLIPLLSMLAVCAFPCVFLYARNASEVPADSMIPFLVVFSLNALLFFVILLVVTASTIRITNKNVHYDA